MKDRDFFINSGKIIIKNKLGGINDNFAGITNESIVLGIDKKGNGRLAKSETFAGIALLIPIVAYHSSTYRFKKID